MTISTTLRMAMATAIAATWLAACNDDFGEPAPSQLVVEGWIDNGRFPIVLLSRTVPVTNQYQSVSTLYDYVEKWARVAVSDGEREVVLVGHYDDHYFPPYVYTTSDMRGQTGRTYRLTIDCLDGTHAEATTTIGQPVEIDSVTFATTTASDTLRQMYAHIHDDGTLGNKYKVFTRVWGRDGCFLPAYMGITTSQLLPDNGRVAVNNGRSNMGKDFTPYFTLGDMVMVKIAVIDDAAYAFWRDFEDMVTLATNPFFPTTINLSSNVSGAMGYWFGYASNYCTVRVGRNMTMTHTWTNVDDIVRDTALLAPLWP